MSSIQILKLMTGKQKREVILIPDCPPCKHTEDNSECISFYSESENSNIASNRTNPTSAVAIEQFPPLYSVTHLALDSSKFTHAKLLKMLQKYGEYPDKYRLVAWRYLLSLPLNKAAYEKLLSFGIHPAYRKLRQQHPIRSSKLFCRTQRLLSALAYWCPLLAEIDYLPAFVYPFAKVLEHDDLVLFEILVSIFSHWLQHFFVKFPQPPVKWLQAVEDIIMREDPELGRHMKSANFHPVQYAWPLLQSIFSDVLVRCQWVAMMDWLVAYFRQPQLLFALVAAYVLQLRTMWMSTKDPLQLAACVKRMSPVDVKRMVRKGRELVGSMSGTEQFECRLPIGRAGESGYRELREYPDYVVELGAQMRRQVIEQELDIARQKQLVRELHKKNERLLEEEVKLRNQQEGVLRAEKERIALMTAETEVEVLARKAQLNKEKAGRLAYLRNCEAKLAESLQAEERLRKLKEDNLAASYNRRAVARRQEALEQTELDEVKNLEYKTTEKISELVRLRQTDAASLENAARQELYESEAESRQRKLEQKWRTEDQETMIQRHDWLKDREVNFEAKRAGQMQTIQEQKQELVRRERELELARLEHERQMRRLAEEDVYSHEDLHIRSIYPQTTIHREEVASSVKSNPNIQSQSQGSQPQSVYDHFSSSEEQKCKLSKTHEAKISQPEEHKEALLGTNYSEPFTFKNTATGFVETKGAPEELLLRSQEQEMRASASFPEVQEGYGLVKTISYQDKNALVSEKDLMERHTRVKQQLEDLQRRFASAQDESEPSVESNEQSEVSASGEVNYDESSDVLVSGSLLCELIETSKEMSSARNLR
eukprot:TRINITY_DN12208_c0_g1_i29.p1 TRINITY_DN12208_c0_g1~~TRINITY_DN12208_c0_g1_i29.p1  ORF type:complete len:827 (+),score=256.38 TRINITY_DN12208_c0_g1_i29:112-2592(+)